MERQASRHQTASSIRFCHDPLLLRAEWPARSQLRASNEHSLLIFPSFPEAPMLVQLRPSSEPFQFSIPL
jgi:hypothetical protein